MRFILFVIDDRTMSALPGEMVAIDAFNKQLQADNQWIMAAGIGAPETATVFDQRGVHDSTAKGSLFAGRNFYSGFWVIEAKDYEVASQLAKQGSKACNRKVELRPFL
jgi:hypothetical protein